MDVQDTDMSTPNQERIEAAASAIVQAWTDGMHPMMKQHMQDEEHWEQARVLASIALAAADGVVGE